MFQGFETFDISTSATAIHGRYGGSGPPVLLLHGIPETHLMWHRIAPQLTERFTVVAPNTSRSSVRQRRSTPSAKSIVPRRRWIASTTKQTAVNAASPARQWSCGVAAAVLPAVRRSSKPGRSGPKKYAE